MSPSVLRYSVVSGICLAIHNAVMIATDFLGANLWQAVLLSFCVVVIVGFLLHSRYTFRTERSWRGLGRYTMAMSLNIPLALLATGFWHEILQLPMILAAPLATVIMMIFNFFASRWATQPKRTTDSIEKIIS